MKTVLLLLFVWLKIGTPDLSACRRLLDGSFGSEKVTGQFYGQLKDVDEDDAPVMLGFRAMSEFMMSKHLVNPFSRISHFNRGRRLLEAAIEKDHTSAELLFFRLAIQSNAPSLLRYSSNIREDKLNLICYLKTGANQPHADKELHKRIKYYLLVNPYCTGEEKTLIKTL
ncbi:hypothetical protein [Pedobacter hartonius]|uniref:Tetratricopeptide repeat-containing protein n=1 Tax=Pedobacter hartonius TaxID=425514 RepID=A0A1H4H0W9_9SPHI|nr:hypothetical protein [Pedobacter hartonius]SEB15396.1 hypothetical protein SAMN05443550_112152 [Pedobacter hartonius]